jgi:RNA polymerase sigma factor (TIGR02999 family)
MSEVSQLLSAIEEGDPQAPEQLLPLVYEDLHRRAVDLMAQEKPGHTLQPTALIHEAYLRLVGQGQPTDWQGRRHFFAACAEAMRRILIETARRKSRHKHGGNHQRQQLQENDHASPEKAEQMLAVDEALDRLVAVNPQAGELVKLRYFAGCTNTEAASLLGISARKADQVWAYARAWLMDALSASPEE